MMNISSDVVTCYGITKDPKTNSFIMIMRFAKNGSLRHHLNNSFNSMDWNKKLCILYQIARGLNRIHDKKLIHHDFHCGNILNYGSIGYYTYITDLGLCQPANANPSQNDEKKIYGVLPYVAPEILRGKEYTQASDIYGFGIIAYEVCTGLPPYHDVSHEEPLAIRICQGLRPKLNYKVPQLVLDIIKQCWDADPLKRPKAKELNELFDNLCHDTCDYYNYHDYDKNSIIHKQIKDADEINKQISASSTTPSLSTSFLSYTIHPQAVYTSKLLDFKNLPEPNNVKDDFLEDYSGN